MSGKLCTAPSDMRFLRLFRAEQGRDDRTAEYDNDLSFPPHNSFNCFDSLRFAVLLFR